MVRMGLSFLAALLVTVAPSQAPKPQLRFGAVSIKREPPDYRLQTPAHGPVWPGGRYSDRQAILWSLIVFAHPQYVYPEKTIVGLPGWAYGQDGAWFDIDAVPEAGTSPTLAQMQQMMDAVLADRFQLRYHIEHRPMKVYFLEVGPGGTHHIAPAQPGDQSLQFRAGDTGIFARGASMDELAGRMGSYYMDRPLLNRTGLNGFYDIDYQPHSGGYFSRQDRQSRAQNLLEQMGFKLVAGKADVPVMVVDHVAMPTAN